MCKRLFLTALLVLSAVSLLAQTVDFTTVTVNTERVKQKKVFEKRSFVLATGKYLNVVASNHSAVSSGFAVPTLGVRYGFVRLFGFYGGVSMALDGFPSRKDSEWISAFERHKVNKGNEIHIQTENGNPVSLTGEFKNPRFSVETGLIVRFARSVNMYLGPSLVWSQDLAVGSDGKQYFIDERTPSFGLEGGLLFHINRLSTMIGVGLHNGPDVSVGLGYNF